jgi:hypothetical protein
MTTLSGGVAEYTLGRRAAPMRGPSGLADARQTAPCYVARVHVARTPTSRRSDRDFACQNQADSASGQQRDEATRP